MTVPNQGLKIKNGSFTANVLLYLLSCCKY